MLNLFQRAFSFILRRSLTILSQVFHEACLLVVLVVDSTTSRRDLLCGETKRHKMRKKLLIKNSGSVCVFVCACEHNPIPDHHHTSDTHKIVASLVVVVAGD